MLTKISKKTKTFNISKMLLPVDCDISKVFGFVFPVLALFGVQTNNPIVGVYIISVICCLCNDMQLIFGLICE